MRKFLGTVIALSTLTLIGVSVAGAQGNAPLELVNKVANFYDTSLGIGLILALGIITYAGILYTISAGNASRQSEAKKWLLAALGGLLLLFGSFVVMASINPQLTKLDEVVFSKNIRAIIQIVPIPEPPVFFNDDPGPSFCANIGETCSRDIDCCNLDCTAIGRCNLNRPDPTDVPPQCREICEKKFSPGAPECLSLEPCPEVYCPAKSLTYKNSWLNARSSSRQQAQCIAPDTGKLPKRNHLGTDINVGGGCTAPVFAIETGTIISLSKGTPGQGCGLRVILDADSNNWYRYCHLLSIAPGLRVGSRVGAGEHIAFNGKSGNANGCHIHFEVKGWASGCGNGTFTCGQNPGCYQGKNNPVPVLNYACSLNIPTGGDVLPPTCIPENSGCSLGNDNCCGAAVCVLSGPTAGTCKSSTPSCIPENSGCSLGNDNCCGAAVCILSGPTAGTCKAQAPACTKDFNPCRSASECCTSGATCSRDPIDNTQVCLP